VKTVPTRPCEKGATNVTSQTICAILSVDSGEMKRRGLVHLHCQTSLACVAVLKISPEKDKNGKLDFCLPGWKLAGR
jgi:hypothetical protein